jgi:hypothetical protein
MSSRPHNSRGGRGSRRRGKGNREDALMTSDEVSTVYRGVTDDTL